MIKVHIRKEENTCKLEIVLECQIHDQGVEQNINSIDKSHPIKWTLPTTFMNSQLEFPKLMKKVHIGKEKHTCKLEIVL